MTVAELVGIAQGEIQNVLALSEASLTLTTGYLLVAYFVGAKLTFFQVSLVNVIFLLSRTANYISMQAILERLAHFQQRVTESDPAIPVGYLGRGDTGSVASTTIVVLITIGCLIFMWQVRHSKTE
jgi:hypothetical protein